MDASVHVVPPKILALQINGIIQNRKGVKFGLIVIILESEISFKELPAIETKYHQISDKYSDIY